MCIRDRYYRTLAVFCVVFLLNGKISYGGKSSHITKENSITAIRVKKGPKIDGYLNDDVWQLAEKVSNFRQTNPIEGAPVSEKTTVRVLYDNENLYFAFECFDSEVDKIVRRITERDSRASSDNVKILLDTYHDGRNAFIFRVNATGVQSDAVYQMGGGRRGRRREWGMGDLSWDGLWKAEVKVNSKGWFAEIAIPFKTLRFSTEENQVWGINFSRDIERKNETACWMSYKRNDTFKRVDKAGHLLGLKGINPGHNIEILPYAMTSREKIETDGKTENFFDKNSGLDIKYGITPNITADITLNPDFGQVESDIERIEVSRYEKYYPEKRPFFLEGVNIFNSPINLFYSRRIGKKLPDGSTVKILGGGKLTGKTRNGYSFGILNSITERKEYKTENTKEVEPLTNFSVIRIKKDILNRSYIGFITTSKDRKENGELDYSRTFGIDANFIFRNYYNFSVMIAKSINPGINKDNYGFTSQFTRNTDRFYFSASYTEYGKEFNINAIGFLNQNDRRKKEISFRYKPRPERFGIRQIQIGPSFENQYSIDGIYQGGRLSGSINFTFDFPEKFWKWGYWRGSFDFGKRNEYYKDVNNTDRWTWYTYHYYSTRLSTDFSKPFFIMGNGSVKDFLDYRDMYYGKSKSFSITTFIVPKSNLSFGLTINNIYEYYSNGKLDELKKQYVFRVNYSITRDLFIKVLAQRKIDSSRGYTINALIGRYINAKSIFYLVFNASKEEGDYNFDNKVFFGKLSYLFKY